jgi:hypothetical protein
MGKPTIEIRPGVYNSTVYIITADDERDVDAAVEDIAKRYPTVGYGTIVEKKGYNLEGKPFAQVWRSNSCD